MVYLRKDCILREEYHNIKQNLSILRHGHFFIEKKKILSCFRQQLGRCRTDMIIVFGSVLFHLHPRLEGRHSHLKQMVNVFYVETQTHQKVLGD